MTRDADAGKGDEEEKKVMLDDETTKEIHQAIEEMQPEIRGMASALVENLFKSVGDTLVERKLEPITEREKIILISIASAITMQTITASIAMSFESKS